MKKISKANTAYMVRTCNSDMTSYNGFKWPKKGYIKAPDFNDKKECGGGLHGLLWGIGSAQLCDLSTNATWLLCKVDIKTVIDLENKVKVPFCHVVKTGKREEIFKMLAKYGADVSKMIFGTATAGDRGTATAGNAGTATAGDAGTATAGDAGTATAGDFGTATAGNAGTATAGDFGTATAGNAGTATAGDFGTVIIKYWNGSRYKYKIGYTGEDLKPNVKYRLNENHEFEVVK